MGSPTVTLTAIDSVNPTSPAADDVSAAEKEGQLFLQKESLWEKEMKLFTPSRRYSKVECLLLYFRKERENEGFLNVEPEVEELSQVFKQQYGYGVKVAELNEHGKSSATAALRYRLSELIHHHDARDSLLIVYYAGHGYVAEQTRDADLLLVSRSPDETAEARRMEATWRIAEEMLKDLDADVLLLFDCCFAGVLCGPMTRAPSPRPKNFDFLGACSASELTKGPGPRSFTRAMIESLKTLASEETGFPISVLQNEIINYKDFPKHKQTPSSASRTNSAFKMLLSPLKKDDFHTPPPDAAIEEEHLDYCVTLDLLFDHIPDSEQFEDFCNGFKHTGTYGQPAYKKIAWRSMHRRSRREILVRRAVETWRRRALTSTGEASTTGGSSSTGEPWSRRAPTLMAKKRKLSPQQEDDWTLRFEEVGF